MTEHFHTLDCVGTNCKPAPAAEPVPLTAPNSTGVTRLTDVLDAGVAEPVPLTLDAPLREALRNARYSNDQTHGAHTHGRDENCGGEYVVGNCIVRAALARPEPSAQEDPT